MILEINSSSSTPIYLQIVEQIHRRIARGALTAEDPLPSVRQLALELTINPNTVARAYLELEFQGVIYKRQAQGTYVSPGAGEASRVERDRMVAALFARAISEAASFGMTPEEIDGVYQKQWRAHR
ncbi:MAG: GntR family transcriptional regulator [Bryobacteraceae bacterium]|nr:GntR family transcriptional regulator [Bryobacteraceae bacterium]